MNVAPVVVELNVTACVEALSHMDCGAGLKLTAGDGLTVTVAVIGVPGHPLAVGVIV